MLWQDINSYWPHIYALHVLWRNDDDNIYGSVELGSALTVNHVQCCISWQAWWQTRQRPTCSQTATL